MTAQLKARKLIDALGKRGLTRGLLFDYGYLLGGQVGRLIFSVAYFITLARTLSLSDFGLFATASAIGVVMARIAGFGFISPLYRVATTKPQLIGTYTAGYSIALLISLPLIAALTGGIYGTIYSGSLTFVTFALIIATEVLCWRSLEVLIIVLNGRRKFALGSALTIIGVATKAIAALGFALYSQNDLATWAMIYAISNAVLAVVAIALFYPKQKLRWRPKAWLARLRDALAVSMAEVLFYIQAELDKVLVLAFGGEATAGIYAIIMRLVDLTAMPLRSLNTMLVQWIMRVRQSGESTGLGIAIDAGIAAVSTLGLAAMWVLLALTGTIIGENIALGASFLLLVLFVPGFRNCIEYHTDLLYAHEETTPRVALLALLGVMKAMMLSALLLQSHEFATFALWLNAIFGMLYLISALVTYRFILNRKEVDANHPDQSL